MPKFGQRLPRRNERIDTAIGSMVNGTIAGDSKVGMPIVEQRRVPLVAPASDCPPAFSAGWLSGSGTDQFVNVTYPTSVEGDRLVLFALTDGLVGGVSGFGTIEEVVTDGLTFGCYEAYQDGFSTSVVLALNASQPYAYAIGRVPGPVDGGYPGNRVADFSEDLTGQTAPYAIATTPCSNVMGAFVSTGSGTPSVAEAGDSGVVTCPGTPTGKLLYFSDTREGAWTLSMSAGPTDIAYGSIHLYSGTGS